MIRCVRKQDCEPNYRASLLFDRTLEYFVLSPGALQKKRVVSKTYTEVTFGFFTPSQA